MIQKLLIANRGEIACRIMRTCRRLGIFTVAVYSQADVGARHVREADEAVYLGGSAAGDSYLFGEKLIAAAKRTGADAVHPGYGFLAENAAFARACAAAGLLFVGPEPAAMELMGNKRAAKLQMEAVGVPVLPGYHGEDQTDERLSAVSHTIGFPLMIKAAAGGGGKGMRLVHTPDSLLPALAAARRESLAAFGSDDLILEKALLNPRHIEVQVFGDQHGHIIHLGERDCSVQRRQQKVIEESPAVGISPALRAVLGQTAVQVATAVHYSNAGTVEFLLDADHRFYFLEMNTRIQVEHPVTECLTGIDLVEWQLRVAEGEPLPLSQEQVSFQGHAIEARVYAENPANHFLPVTGPVALWREPSDEGIRVDSGLLSQDAISIYYDPMIAKIIAHGPDRQTARRRLLRALAETRLVGLIHNIPFLQAVVAHTAFAGGEVTTQFIPIWFADWQPKTVEGIRPLIAVSICQFWQHPKPDTTLGYWRNSANRPLLYPYQNHTPVALLPQADHFICQVDGVTYTATAEWKTSQDWVTSQDWETSQELVLTLDGHRCQLTVVQVAGQWWVASAEGNMVVTPLSLLPKPAVAADAGGSLRAPMPGVVLAVMVQVGQVVEKGQGLLKLEAMKMEHTIRSAAAGVVTAVFYQPGDQVEADAQLLRIEVGDLVD